jgi:hypothetical protein
VISQHHSGATTLKGYTSAFDSAAFSPGGKRIASGSGGQHGQSVGDDRHPAEHPCHLIVRQEISLRKFGLHLPASFGLEQVCHHRKHIAATFTGCYRVDVNRVRFPLLERFPRTLDASELEGDIDLAFECG